MDLAPQPHLVSENKTGRFDPFTGKWGEGAKSPERLVFDPISGKMSVTTDDPGYVVSPGMASEGFFGGKFVAASSAMDRITIKRKSWFKPDITVETMHISCKSDTYQEDHNYGGIIIYQYNGKSEWRTANNTHCKPGYIVIQDTGSENVEKLKSEELGQVHGAVYRNAFGESKTESVVGEGFAIQDGKIKFNSGVFNNPKGSPFHDGLKWMNELSEHCVRKVVKEWMTAGSSGVKQRNFDVKQLLDGFNIAYHPTLQVDEDNNTRFCNIL